MLVAAQVVCVVTTLVMIAGVLAHRGSGGGLSDLLGSGGGSVASSAHANRNLTRLTVAAAAVWALSVVVIGLLAR